MTGLRDTLRYQLRASDTLQRLLIVNIGLFVLLRMTSSISGLFMSSAFSFQSISEWLAIPSSTERLIVRPWTLLTYMFYHWDFLHLLFNMLWLFYMGQIFREYLGSKKLLTTYLLGGISGAFLYVIAYNTFPLFSQSLHQSFALGASASVLAITIATATLLPDYTIPLIFIGPVKLKWIALVTIFLDVINLSSSNAGGHIAHLGGAIYGFIYIIQLRKGRDLSGWLQKLIWPGKKAGKMRTVHSRSSRSSDDHFLLDKKARQERLDALLDKINKSGYASLTEEEKQFLFNASKEG